MSCCPKKSTCSIIFLVLAVIIGLLAIPYNNMVKFNTLRDPTVVGTNGCCCSEVLAGDGEVGQDLTPLMAHRPVEDPELLKEVEILSLVQNKYTDPYWVSAETMVQSAKFFVVRKLTYFAAFVHGLLTSLPYMAPAEVMEDRELEALFESQWPFCSLLRHNTSAASDGKDYYYDGSALGYLFPLPGYYTAGTVTRFRIDENRKLHVTSITVNNKDVVFPGDSDPWKLAKFYVLQSAHYLVKFSQHPHIHFNWDAMIAITEHWLPSTHVIRSLMAPHFEFIRNIDQMVLMSHETVLNAGKDAGTPWAVNIQTCDRDQIMKFIRYGQTNKNFSRKPLCSSLQPWYQAIRTFVHTVLTEQQLLIDDDVKRWAKSINIVLQYGLPEGDALSVQDVEDVIVDGIYRISVQHSADHYGFLQVSTKKLPMVTRIAWAPDAAIGGNYQLQSKWDGFKEHMYEQMFVKWWNNYYASTALVDAKYDFGVDNKKPELVEAVKTFRKDLEHASEITFLPLNAVSKAIEW